jgi:hypothetical protein
MCSIPTGDKNFTNVGDGEDREVAVPGPPKVVGPGLLQKPSLLLSKGVNDDMINGSSLIKYSIVTILIFL